jgi:hypothetical protein
LLAKGRRWLDHHHPAAFGARQNLPNGRRIADRQPRPARRTRNRKSFHARRSRPRSIGPCLAPLQNGWFPRAKSRWCSAKQGDSPRNFACQSAGGSCRIELDPYANRCRVERDLCRHFI